MKFGITAKVALFAFALILMTAFSLGLMFYKNMNVILIGQERGKLEGEMNLDTLRALAAQANLEEMPLVSVVFLARVLGTLDAHADEGRRIGGPK